MLLNISEAFASLRTYTKYPILDDIRIVDLGECISLDVERVNVDLRRSNYGNNTYRVISLFAMEQQDSLKLFSRGSVDSSIVTALMLGSPFFTADSEISVENIYKTEATLYFARKKQLLLKTFGTTLINRIFQRALKGRRFNVNDAVFNFFSSIKP